MPEHIEYLKRTFENPTGQDLPLQQRIIDYADLKNKVALLRKQLSNEIESTSQGQSADITKNLVSYKTE